MRFLHAFVLKHRGLVIGLTLLLTAVCGFLWMQVGINFSMADYLPADAPSTRALAKIEEVSGAGLPNAEVYVEGVTIAQALEMKERLRGAAGVESVLWLDDACDPALPVEGQDDAAMFYRDGNARFLVAVSGDAVRGVAALREAAGENAVVIGELVRESTIRTDTMGEVGMIMVYLVPLILAVLLLTTTSWLQPILFLFSIGVAIVINAGTNIIFGEISFITQATSAILQLAVSIDYAVFLLNRFNKRREGSATQRMLMAMKESSVTIAASAMTTVFGFLSLTLMRFKIGPDLGFALAKGVLISYLSVTLFLPPLTILLEKPLLRFSHRRFLPSFKRFGRFSARVCAPVAVVVALILVPAYLAQRGNDFVYGSAGLYAADSRVMRDEARVHAAFEELQEFVILTPEGDFAAEAAFADALAREESIAQVVSYANRVGPVPPEMLTAAQLSAFRVNGYSRILAYAQTPDESAEAFRVVERVRALAEAHFSESHVLSRSAVNDDLMETITGDNLRVLVAGIVAIGVVLLLAFKNAFLPLILILTIQGGIWINMALPNLMGGRINYLGYQIISAVQLGATID